MNDTIPLFALPEFTIHSRNMDHVLHGTAVHEFEDQFAEYVGGQAACSFNSATSAIFLTMRMIKEHWSMSEPEKYVWLPSTLPPVVPNAVLAAGWNIVLGDNTDWIGGRYSILERKDIKVYDCAQVVIRNMMKNMPPDVLAIFSFYPTKPVGSIDGGMVVSNDPSKIEALRIASMNGASLATNSWERVPTVHGHKMYMNTAQAQIASASLASLPLRDGALDMIRADYDLGLEGIPKPDSDHAHSMHLYRIYVPNNARFIKEAKKHGIICGIHYRALHCTPLFAKYMTDGTYNDSEFDHLYSVSIPFHSKLMPTQIERVIQFILDYTKTHGKIIR